MTNTPIKALFFGSIGALAETSELQRQAYNQALKEGGLNWHWDRATYSTLLEMSGGKDRLGLLSDATHGGLDTDKVDMIHTRKTELACTAVLTSDVTLRPGVEAAMDLAKSRGMKIGFVTTTYAPNIDAILQATGLTRDDFDIIVGREGVKEGKPSPEAYTYALKALGLSAEDCLAVEDTANSVMSAKRAGIHTIATPGALTSNQDFWQADLVVASLADESGKLREQVFEQLNR